MCMPWLRLWKYSWQPILIKLINTGKTFTRNPKNCTNNFNKFWINPVMIIQKNSISFSHFKLFCSNWVPRKVPIIPTNLGVFIFHLLYVLNMKMIVGKIGIVLSFVVLCIYIVQSNDKTSLDYFAKLTPWYSPFSWTCMNLKNWAISN